MTGCYTVTETTDTGFGLFRTAYIADLWYSNETGSPIIMTT